MDIEEVKRSETPDASKRALELSRGPIKRTPVQIARILNAEFFLPVYAIKNKVVGTFVSDGEERRRVLLRVQPALKVA